MNITDDELQKHILDSLPYGVYCMDPNRKIFYWNESAERITGYRSQEMIGRHCYENGLDHIDGHGIHLCHAMCPMTATMFDGKLRKAHVWLRSKKGNRIPVLVQTAPIYQDGQITGAIEYFYPIENA